MCVFRFRRALLVFLLCFAAINGRAQQFEGPVVVSNRFRLSLLGTNGAPYAIDSSVNLSNWALLYSATASNGRVVFDAPMSNAPKQFFRGRAVTDGGEIRLAAGVVTNFYASTLAVTDGAETILYAPNGTTFTLTFPSNTVADPNLVKMSLITNLGGLPFAGPMLGAVKIEAADPDFLGAARLRISVGTNVDRRKIISFRANTNGAEFTLAPDRVGTNGVMIPIFGAGIYGSTLCTTQEIMAVGQRISGSSPVLALATKDKKKPLVAAAPMRTSTLCFPERVAEAVTIRNQIKAAMRAIHNDIAVIIGIERQRQLFGIGNDPGEIFSQVGPLSCQFYNQHIAPHWPETASNCALMSVLLEASLGLERQMQLLGVPDEERCTASVLSAERLCPGFKACLEEIKACCLGGHKERERLADLATLARQQALLGIDGRGSLGCFDLNDAVAQETIAVCTEMTWIGTMEVKESGNTVERLNFSNGYSEDTRDYRMDYNGFVKEASEFNMGSFGVQANIKCDGTFSAREVDNRYSESRNQCGTMVSLFRAEGNASSSALYQVTISLQQSNYTIFFGFIGKDDQSPVDGEEVNTTVTTTAPGIGCTGMERKTTVTTEKQNFLGPSLPFFTGALGSNTNNVSGSTNFAYPRGFPDTQVTFKWDFTRVPRGGN